MLLNPVENIEAMAVAQDEPTALGSDKQTGAPLLVAVTSGNKEKVLAVQEAFNSSSFVRQLGREVEVASCPSESGIPHGQPWGMQHTYEGALARLVHLKAACAGGVEKYDYLVSVENGVVALLRHDGTEALDMCCVVVEQRSPEGYPGEQAFNFSQARPYPLAQTQELKRQGKSNEELGSFCRDWYKALEAPILSRGDQVRTATSAALDLLSSSSKK
mmetsp:Transcript_91008/g.161194  ORF Transcript_91008/g.161194 Transcript_91008/m.161194 type:complete len:217 (+) Transcript_91008:37-687(+)